jgi:hypothetical protein
VYPIFWTVLLFIIGIIEARTISTGWDEGMIGSAQIAGVKVCLYIRYIHTHTHAYMHVDTHMWTFTLADKHTNTHTHTHLYDRRTTSAVTWAWTP